MTDQELKELVASLAFAQAKTDEQLAKTDEQLAKTDEQLAKTDSRLNRLCERYGNSENTKGQVAEEFFYTSLDKDKQLGGVQYNDIGRGWIKRKDDREEEYDIILTNGNHILIIEVKYIADLRHVKQLERKVENFKYMFPVYKNFIIRGGLASMKINKEVEELLLEKSFLIITQKGNHLEIKGK